MKARACFVATALAVAALGGATATARADVDHQGAWPAGDPKVSLRFAGPRTEALQKLAETSGWSLVLPAQLAGPKDVRVEIKDQDPKDVLDAVLDEGAYVATRKGSMVTVRSVASSTAASPAASATAEVKEPQVATQAPLVAPITDPNLKAPDAKADEPAEDRSVVGGTFVLARGERAHHLQIVGGKAEVFGEVTGDVTVTGGKAVLHDGARVFGDATVVGGKLEVERGARVDGHAGIVGGVLKRHPGSVIGGKTITGSSDDSTPEESSVATSAKSRKSETGATGFVHKLGRALRNTAIMFVVGVLLFGLAGGRMERLQAEVAARPMRTVGVGATTALLAAVGLTLLCVTVVGIPVALLIAATLGVGLYTSMIAVVSTLGRGLIGHRSKSPYAHLALGCALLFVISLLPYVGPLAICGVVLMGLGSFIATRGAGVLGSAREATA